SSQQGGIPMGTVGYAGNAPSAEYRSAEIPSVAAISQNAEYAYKAKALYACEFLSLFFLDLRKMRQLLTELLLSILQTRPAKRIRMNSPSPRANSLTSSITRASGGRHERRMGPWGLRQATT